MSGEENALESVLKEIKEIEIRELERQKESLRDRERMHSLREKLFELQIDTSRKASFAMGCVELSQKEEEMGNCIGLDIGGTLAKLVFFDSHSENNQKFGRISQFVRASEYYGKSGQRIENLSFKFEEGTFHFILFLSTRMTNAIELIVANQLHKSVTRVTASGGGAIKYTPEFKKIANIEVVAEGELECMVRGLVFLLRHYDNELYTLRDVDTRSSAPPERIAVRSTFPSMFPFIVVNIGSGVSILNVESESRFERVSGTALGGGTYLGLCRLLTKCQSFEEALKLAESGDSHKIDLLVGDIYGGRCDALDLEAATVAACFGKMIAPEHHHDPTDPVRPQDYALALLKMISFNIGQIANLIAKQLQAKHIIFAGNFLRHNSIAQRTLAYATRFWSLNQTEAYFLSHEGFCGALGALLYSNPLSSVPPQLFSRKRTQSLC
eukprot:c17263_g1_i1.p1 GENE.c17263_g1_i1~~c17263_g1_i1.p1  ORF type:complete len:440 (-),score=165.97 c17263_g1_i1:58-1377(-)